jgi:hypothetical protein
MLGLGNRLHNKNLWMKREAERPVRNDVNRDIQLWYGLWRHWQGELIKEEKAAAQERTIAQAGGGKIQNSFFRETGDVESRYE